MTVEKTADFPKAFEAAQKSGMPALVHLKIDPNALTPMTTLEALRAKALVGQGR